jgi:nucleoside-diphosphate-sugar epimerase
MDKNSKIVISGASGLVGQNLIVMLKEQGYKKIVALDKHEYNTAMLRRLHPEIEVITADLAEPGGWADAFVGAQALIMLQAQITSKISEPFVRNNITATELILGVAKQYALPYIVHISSSVVISAADDDYTKTKKAQEEMVRSSGLKHCVLRPTLMFGWFDKKHLGWLSRFMARIPVFPIPGDGKYLRQPLYVRDFCAVIVKAMETQPDNKVYDIIGRENIDYIDIIRTIKRVKNLNTLILNIPYSLFYFLLKLYAVFSTKPPFTADQLKALTAGDKFVVFPWWDEFGVTPTSFADAMRETHCHSDYSQYILNP